MLLRVIIFCTSYIRLVILDLKFQNGFWSQIIRNTVKLIHQTATNPPDRLRGPARILRCTSTHEPSDSDSHSCTKSNRPMLSEKDTRETI